MCDVHLVPEVDELRKAKSPLVCGECTLVIRQGEQHRYIEGPLDDASGERYRYIAHEDCYLLSVTEVNDDGCFTFGGAERL